jgi:hypothetical protein
MQRLAAIEAVIAEASEEQIRRNLFHLSEDPLPFRKVNHTRPGATKNTLEETDAFLAEKLATWGYTLEYEPVQVQPFRCDTTKHPSHWYSTPDPADPWFVANNVYAKKTGTARPEQIVVVVSHKDSPSWIDCPGARDNAAGTCCNLEVARLLARYPLQKSVWFLYCNEEHHPWTSVTAAQAAKARGDDLVAIFNLDGQAAKSVADQEAGRKVSSAIYGTPEGERLADLLGEVNDSYAIGLEQSKHFRAEPGNDDGSFLNAGYPAAVGCHGSQPYDDPTYHRPEDVPERLDTENVRRVAQLIAAAVLTLDQE